ncbi:hypothetical protein CYY_003354 [Polysphondylium violaceum]|uniref:UBC core domain-containing protein n=1 Tax=Polysphondylium violaceum TaxID=133409 RepID=A0A8J4PWV2_9MYCE|nr:hypothetical protein CYY_003354 [Polysphondylium violaceum]
MEQLDPLQSTNTSTPSKVANTSQPAPIVEAPNYRLLYEYKKLSELLIRGLYVIPSLNSIHEWHCVLFIRNRIYRSAIIRFVVIIPDDFPEICPSVKFITPIFHPLIGLEGEIDLSHQFSDWSSEKYMIAHILCYIKSLFYKPDQYDYPPLNTEAYNLMKNNPEEFSKRVSKHVQDSIKNVYNNEETLQSPIEFTKEWKDKNQWENTKKQILAGKKDISISMSGFDQTIGKIKDFWKEF